MKNTLLTTLIFMVLVSCSKDSITTTPPPTVDFSYSGASLPAPATITFTSSTTNATSYLWDFGDNGTSTVSNPQHLYSTSGVYTVKLTATGAGGSTSTTKTVNISPALTKVKIAKMTIVNIPFTKPGGTTGWDLNGSGPDVYFKIEDVQSNILFDATSSARIDDVTPSMLPKSWNITTPFAITDLTSSIFINLYDYNITAKDEDMSYVRFLMSNYVTGANAYPSTVTNTQNGITIKLDLIWYN
jgi:PKD repeat protein